MKTRTRLALLWLLLLCLLAACAPSGTTAAPPGEAPPSEEAPSPLLASPDPLVPNNPPPPEGFQGEEKATNFDYDYDALTYELVWNDEFGYVGLPDPEKWNYDVGGHGWGNNELQYYTDDGNASANGEVLTIEARAQIKNGKEYTSARLVTKNKGDWLYGKIEVRAKLPGGRGTWPAIWMLPTDWDYGDWPASGEIDIMEHVGYDPNKVHATVHTGAYNHTKGTQLGNGGVVVDQAVGGFHTYGIEWLPDKILFFIDGEQVYEYNPSGIVVSPTYQEWPFDRRHHILINIALGGDWGGAQGFDPEMLPAAMEVDYVRVYQSPEITSLERTDTGGRRELGMTGRGNWDGTGAALRTVFITENAGSMWSEQAPGSRYLTDDGKLGAVEIAIDPNRLYQPIDGFGASFTDSAAYLINQKLSEEDKESLMVNLFDPEDGIGLSFVRNPMGASDFAREIYSYDDMPEGETDYGLDSFSIDRDREDIIPLLKRALKLNPQLKLVASPWSPPGWMKSSGSMIGGTLSNSSFDAYGNYFIRFLEEYQKEGIEFYAVTPQNEPLYVPNHYPGCSMPPAVQSQFIKNSLGPKLDEFFPNVKLLCYDHNWDRKDYPEHVLRTAGEYVDGVAWHVYGGSVEAQSEVLAQFLDSEVHFTEASGGDWVPPFDEAFFGEIRTGIQVLNNFSRSMVLWNMALDENNGPVVPGFGQSICRGVVLINQQTGGLTYNLDYYALAHFSKYIRPGAIRVASETKGSVYTTACLNEDGSLVVVALNDAPAAKLIRITVGDQSFDLRTYGRTAATMVIDL
jgi:glucosylceramidase